MSVTVLRKCQRSGIAVPVTWMNREVSSNRLFDGAVESFCLHIILGVTGRHERSVDVQDLADTLGKR